MLPFAFAEKKIAENQYLRLLQKGSTVKGQNNDKTVSFKMTSETAKKLVFENPKHDYPPKITYTLINKDSLVAEISGIQLGKPSSQKVLDEET